MAAPEWGGGTDPPTYSPGGNTGEQPAMDAAYAVDPQWGNRTRQGATPTGLTEAWAPGADEDYQSYNPVSLVRPYARVGGRTKPVRDLSLEALVRTTNTGTEASTSPWLTPEHSTVIDMCTGTVSVAEIAVRLTVPVGVARVIIADMVDLGLVEIMQTSASEGDERDPIFLRRVLSGLQRL